MRKNVILRIGTLPGSDLQRAGERCVTDPRGQLIRRHADGIDLAIAVIGREEKEFVLDQRPADACAILMLLLNRLSCCFQRFPRSR